jgi:hypothetical protein
MDYEALITFRQIPQTLEFDLVFGVHRGRQIQGA